MGDTDDVAGRTAKPGSGIYDASKWAVNAFSESLRQEVTEKGVRVVLIEPGAAAGRRHRRAFTYAVTQPDHVAVNEILVRPTDQATP